MFSPSSRSVLLWQSSLFLPILSLVLLLLSSHILEVTSQETSGLAQGKWKKNSSCQLRTTMPGLHGAGTYPGYRLLRKRNYRLLNYSPLGQICYWTWRILLILIILLCFSNFVYILTSGLMLSLIHI